jgi:hypothetical protein
MSNKRKSSEKTNDQPSSKRMKEPLNETISTSTNETMNDLDVSNETIILLLKDNLEKQKIIDELIGIYKKLEDVIDHLQSI